MPYIGTCFRFYTQMRVQTKNKAFAYRIYSHFTQQCTNNGLRQQQQKIKNIEQLQTHNIETSFKHSWSQIIWLTKTYIHIRRKVLLLDQLLVTHC